MTTGLGERGDRLARLIQSRREEGDSLREIERRAKAAGFEISREMYTVEDSPLFGSRLVNFVHDQFLAEVPEWCASAATLRMNEIMIRVAREYIPDVEIRTEPAITSRWYKGAEPVWQDESKTVLLEWHPKEKKVT